MSTAGERAQIDGAQLMVHLQDRLAGDHILAHQAHVLPGRYRRIDQQRIGIGLVDIFDHDDRVGRIRQGIAGVHGKSCAAKAQRQRRGLARGNGIVGGDRITIHGGTVKMWRRQTRVYRLCRYAPKRLRQLHALAGQRTGTSNASQR